MIRWPMTIDVFGTVRFALVGCVSTTLYLTIAYTASTLGVSAYLSSLLAYATASIFSYNGHRSFTFRSVKSVGETAPRFASLTFVQYVLALIIPAVLTEHAGLPPIVSFVAVTFVAPVVSLIAMSRFVFRPPMNGERHQPGPVKELTHV